MAVHIAVLVHHGIFHAQRLQFLHQQFGQLPLSRCRRTGGSPFGAPGGQLPIAQQPSGHCVWHFHVIDQFQLIGTAVKGVLVYVAPLGQMHHPQAVAVAKGIRADGFQGGRQVQFLQQVAVPKSVILDDPQPFRKVDLFQIHAAAEGLIPNDLQALRQHHFLHTEQVLA